MARMKLDLQAQQHLKENYDKGRIQGKDKDPLKASEEVKKTAAAIAKRMDEMTQAEDPPETRPGKQWYVVVVTVLGEFKIVCTGNIISSFLTPAMVAKGQRYKLDGKAFKKV